MSDQIQEVDQQKLLDCYARFLISRKKQAISNQKYRKTEHGKKKTIEMHKIWIGNKKNDRNYMNRQNENARIRYHIRKANKLAKDELAKDEFLEIIIQDV